MKPTQLYIFQQDEYAGRPNAKIGVSTNPGRRLQNVGRQYDFGGFSLFAVWIMPSRRDAFAVETIVKNLFPRIIGHDCLGAEPHEVRRAVLATLEQTKIIAVGGAV